MKGTASIMDQIRGAELVKKAYSLKKKQDRVNNQSKKYLLYLKSIGKIQ